MRGKVNEFDRLYDAMDRLMEVCEQLIVAVRYAAQGQMNATEIITTEADRVLCELRASGVTVPVFRRAELAVDNDKPTSPEAA